MQQIDITFKREELARYGINIADVTEVIETGIQSKIATRLVDGPMRFAVVVRFPSSEQIDVPALKNIILRGSAGERVPLERVANVALVEGPAQISREKAMRRVATEVNIRGRDLGSFVAEAQKKLAQIEAELTPGYFLEYGGQFENQQRAMKRLAIVVPIALLLIVLLLYLALGSLRDSFLVILNLPFALVGGIIAIWIWGMPLSVSAAVSFIVLLGIAVQNGVVLMAFFRQLRAEGKSVNETVQTGCDVRFRPLIMTALVSFIGHLPMLYATGSGADIQKPLAVVVMGGLITSTLLTLIVLPTVNDWCESRQAYTERRK
jgi:cobalt-zinc-cadmium resistance protein CzcA